eukprot:352664-Chlamydomonas_euryale.AAC.6
MRPTLVTMTVLLLPLRESPEQRLWWPCTFAPPAAAMHLTLCLPWPCKFALPTMAMHLCSACRGHAPFLRLPWPCNFALPTMAMQLCSACRGRATLLRLPRPCDLAHNAGCCTCPRTSACGLPAQSTNRPCPAQMCALHPYPHLQLARESRRAARGHSFRPPSTPCQHRLPSPLRRTCSRRVSLESRYGTWPLFPSTSAEMTFPSADSERLILVASLRRSPVAPVFDWRSDPARSTRLSLPTLMWFSLVMPASIVSIVMVKMECERDESLFMSVAPTDLFFLPTSTTLRSSCSPLTTNELSPLTYTPVSLCSLSSSGVWEFLDSREWIRPGHVRVADLRQSRCHGSSWLQGVGPTWAYPCRPPEAESGRELQWAKRTWAHHCEAKQAIQECARAPKQSPPPCARLQHQGLEQTWHASVKQTSTQIKPAISALGGWGARSRGAQPARGRSAPPRCKSPGTMHGPSTLRPRGAVHGVSLASACLAISKYGAVVAHNGAVDNGARRDVVDLALRNVLVHDMVKRERLGRLRRVALWVVEDDGARLAVHFDNLGSAIGLFLAVERPAPHYHLDALPLRSHGCGYLCMAARRRAN